MDPNNLTNFTTMDPNGIDVKLGRFGLNEALALYSKTEQTTIDDPGELSR